MINLLMLFFAADDEGRRKITVSETKIFNTTSETVSKTTTSKLYLTF